MDLLKTQYENLKYESEKEISSLRERHKGEINDFVTQIAALQEKVDDTRDRDAVRAARRETEEYKRRANEFLSEANELRKERVGFAYSSNRII